MIKNILLLLLILLAGSACAATQTITGNLIITNGTLSVNATNAAIYVNGARVPTTNDLAGLGAASNTPVSITTTSAHLVVVTDGSGTNITVDLTSDLATTGNVATALTAATNAAAAAQATADAASVGTNAVQRGGDTMSGPMTNFSSISVIGFQSGSPTFAEGHAILSTVQVGGAVEYGLLKLQMAYDYTYSIHEAVLTVSESGHFKYYDGVAADNSNTLVSAGTLQASVLSNITVYAAGYATVGSLINYLRIVTVPTNYTAYGEANWVATGWMSGTNFVFWFDATSNRWQRARAEVWP